MNKAIIVGATSGIGHEVAMLLIKKGCQNHSQRLGKEKASHNHRLEISHHGILLATYSKMHLGKTKDTIVFMPHIELCGIHQYNKFDSNNRI